MLSSTDHLYLSSLPIRLRFERVRRGDLSISTAKGIAAFCAFYLLLRVFEVDHILFICTLKMWLKYLCCVWTYSFSLGNVQPENTLAKIRKRIHEVRCVCLSYVIIITIIIIIIIYMFV